MNLPSKIKRQGHNLSGRWGLFGGLFDPVHSGHVQLAENLSKAAGLNGVLWVPSASPPHKTEHPPTAFSHRLEMLSLALEGRPNMDISAIESELELSGYALHTIRAIKKRYPAVEWYFIIGADNIEDISNWYSVEQIYDEISILAGTRPGYSSELPMEQNKLRITYYETRPFKAASSEIRQMIHSRATLEQLTEYLPPEVAQYIHDHGLYR